MLIIPAIDIMAGKVVRLRQGDFGNVAAYGLSPLAFAEKWQSEGATMIHVVDLDGAKAGEPKNFDVVKEIIKRVRLKIEVGGGIRSTEAIRKYLEVGVDRVVLSTRIMDDDAFLLSRKIEPYLSRVVVSIDVKDIKNIEDVEIVDNIKGDPSEIRNTLSVLSATAGWAEEGDRLIDLPKVIQRLVKAGVGYLNFSDIARDGMLKGLDIPKILTFIKFVNRITQGKLFLTYAGGVSSLEDILALKSIEKEGLGAAVVGRALYENKFTLKDAIQAAGNSAA
ncbi:MAG: 1-(5-phosphoribosyl)-5-[(5-phosphoribosylamino)methylideneamino] imidazole-4-carboxamide isomerase [Candidatus Omnitrophota bacterium]